MITSTLTLALGQSGEDPGRHADLVGQIVDGDLRVVESVGDAGDDGLFHAFLFLSYQSSGGIGEAGAHPQGHVEAAGHLDAAQHHDLGAARGEFQHLVVGDEVELAGFGHDARIGGVDAVHVGEDLAGLGAQRRRQGDGRGVGAAAAERGDVLGGRDSLEAGHEDDLVLLEGLVDAVRPDIEDLGLGVRRVGDDAGLRAGQGDRLVAQLVDGHRHKRGRDALAGGEEHVHLARGRVVGDLSRQLDEIVGGVSPGRDDCHHRVALFAGVDDAVGHPFHAGGISHRRTSELHHDDVRPLGFALRSADDDVLRAERVSRSPAAGLAWIPVRPPPGSVLRFGWILRDGILSDEFAFARRGDLLASSRRPVSARPKVTSSAYSRSPPMGRPAAGRVMRSVPAEVRERSSSEM